MTHCHGLLRRILGCVLLCLAVAAPPQQGQQRRRELKESPYAGEYISHKDIAYVADAPEDDVRKLDLHLPKGRKNFPVIVYFPGGSWHVCERLGGLKVADFLCRDGFGVACVTYRTVDRKDPKLEQMFPRFMDDSADAFAWVHANIAKYGGDNTRMMVCGHSAGGHVAALLAVEPSYLKKRDLDAGKVIKGIIGFSGVYDIPKDMEAALDEDRAAKLSRVFPNTQEARDLGSPVKHASKDDPPALLIYGEDDVQTLDVCAEAFAKALTDAGVEASAHKIAGRGHDSSCRRPESDDEIVNRLVRAFAFRHGLCEAQEHCLVCKGLAYAKDASEADPRHVDLYVPTTPSDKPRPCVAFYDGDSWSGSPEAMTRFAPDKLCKAGYAVAVVGYRTVNALAPKDDERFPCFVEDAAEGFAWVHANVSMFGGDRTRMAIAGQTAGAYVAALLATDPQYLKKHSLVVNEAVKAFVGISGLYRIPDDTKGLPPEMAPYLSLAFPKGIDERKAASPITHAGAGDPPTLLLSGERELPLIVESAQAFKDALTSAKVAVEACTVSDVANDSAVARVTEFLGKMLPEQPSATGDGASDGSLKPSNGEEDFVARADGY